MPPSPSCSSQTPVFLFTLHVVMIHIIHNYDTCVWSVCISEHVNMIHEVCVYLTQDLTGNSTCRDYLVFLTWAPKNGLTCPVAGTPKSPLQSRNVSHHVASSVFRYVCVSVDKQGKYFSDNRNPFLMKEKKPHFSLRQAAFWFLCY